MASGQINLYQECGGRLLDWERKVYHTALFSKLTTRYGNDF